MNNMNNNHTQDPFVTVDEAVQIIASGQMLIVVDDENRENEGDLVMAADLITSVGVKFMLT